MSNQPPTTGVKAPLPKGHNVAGRMGNALKRRWSRFKRRRDEALVDACMFGDAAAVAKILDTGGANIDGHRNCRYSPLVAASLCRDASSKLAVVKMLLDRGASVRGEVRWRRNPLYAACHAMSRSAADEEVAVVLVRHGADVDLASSVVRNRTPLFYAVDGKKEDLVLHLLEAGAKPAWRIMAGDGAMGMAIADAASAPRSLKSLSRSAARRRLISCGHPSVPRPVDDLDGIPATLKQYLKMERL